MQMPNPDVYFIQIEPQEQNDAPAKKKGLGKALVAITSVVSAPILPFAGLAVGGSTAAVGAAALLFGKDMKRLYDEKRCFIISSEEELSKFKNASGFAWKYNEKSMRKKQYYIRHPMIAKQNLLIEANNFYKYIDEEQKEELIQFIAAHCPAKRIEIDREEVADSSAGANGSAKGLELSGEYDYSNHKGNYFTINCPNGFPKEEPRTEYYWIDPSLLTSVKYLSEGAVLTQKYESDFRFGFSASEAKTLGLNMNCHKNYIYTVHIEC